MDAPKIYVWPPPQQGRGKKIFLACCLLWRQPKYNVFCPPQQARNIKFFTFIFSAQFVQPRKISSPARIRTQPINVRSSRSALEVALQSIHRLCLKLLFPPFFFLHRFQIVLQWSTSILCCEGMSRLGVPHYLFCGLFFWIEQRIWGHKHPSIIGIYGTGISWWILFF